MNHQFSISDAKGFMLHDFKEALPDCKVAGIDISDYCLENSMHLSKNFVKKLVVKIYHILIILLT